MAKKKTTKKKTKKKTTKKKAEFSLADIEGELSSFGVSVLTREDPEEELAPNIVPFRNLALQKITGGVFGGKFFEVGADSQAGKSFLLYEIAADALKMGGYVLLLDGERALEEAYAKMVGLDIRGGRFMFAEKRTAAQKKKGLRGTPIVDLDEFFKMAYGFIRAIRKVDKDLDKPILVGIDSYPMLRTDTDLTQMEKGQSPKGYAAMQKAAKFYEMLARYLPKYDDLGADLFLLNQLTKDHSVMFGDPWKSNAEAKIKFYATQRLKGRLVGKIVDKKTKAQIGMKTKWTTIKNRGVKPFQSVITKIYYNKGIDIYSGLDELLLMDGTIREATKKATINGKAKTLKGFKMIDGDKFYPTIQELSEDNPSVLEPIWTGSEDLDYEEEVEDVADVDLSDLED